MSKDSHGSPNPERSRLLNLIGGAIADWVATRAIEVAVGSGLAVGIGTYVAGVPMDVVVYAALLVALTTAAISDIARRIFKTRVKVQVGKPRIREKEDRTGWIIVLPMFLDNGPRDQGATLSFAGSLWTESGSAIINFQNTKCGFKNTLVGIHEQPLSISAGTARQAEVTIEISDTQKERLFPGSDIGDPVDFSYQIDVRDRRNNVTTKICRITESSQRTEADDD